MSCTFFILQDIWRFQCSSLHGLHWYLWSHLKFSCACGVTWLGGIWVFDLSFFHYRKPCPPPPKEEKEKTKKMWTLGCSCLRPCWFIMHSSCVGLAKLFTSDLPLLLAWNYTWYETINKVCKKWVPASESECSCECLKSTSVHKVVDPKLWGLILCPAFLGWRENNQFQNFACPQLLMLTVFNVHTPDGRIARQKIIGLPQKLIVGWDGLAWEHLFWTICEVNQSIFILKQSHPKESLADELLLIFTFFDIRRWRLNGLRRQWWRWGRNCVLCLLKALLLVVYLS